jgi:hypothetical protein
MLRVRADNVRIMGFPALVVEKDMEDAEEAGSGS